MALANALESITDPNHQAILQKAVLNDYTKERTHIQSYNPYAQLPINAELLQSFGIPSNPTSVLSHPHSANKAIRNYIHQEIMHHNTHSDVTVLFCRVEKVKLMKIKN
jgi:hypothetical protein